MSQPPRTPQNASPLTARMYDLEYPRSLGVYSTYQEVQSVVDTLADRQFPVQSTLIVGTDLKLMERVTGRRTWPRVISQGVLSGLWMGLFFGLLLLLITPGNIMIVLTSVLMGIVFFTVWSVIGYAMTGGRRDFTSMTATIPMQYELLVEHKHADQARSILAETGAVPTRTAPTTPIPGHAQPTGPQFGAGPAQGQGQQGAWPQGPGSWQQGPGQQPPSGAPQSPQPSPNAGHPRPSYGRPATSASEAPNAEAPRGGRPSFGQPAGTPLHEGTSPSPSEQDGGDTSR